MTGSLNMLERISHAAINFLIPINKPKINYFKKTGISTSVYSSVTYGGLYILCARQESVSETLSWCGDSLCSREVGLWRSEKTTSDLCCKCLSVFAWFMVYSLFDSSSRNSGNMSNSRACRGYTGCVHGLITRWAIKRGSLRDQKNLFRCFN